MPNITLISFDCIDFGYTHSHLLNILPLFKTVTTLRCRAVRCISLFHLAFVIRSFPALKTFEVCSSLYKSGSEETLLCNSVESHILLHQLHVPKLILDLRDKELLFLLQLFAPNDIMSFRITFDHAGRKLPFFLNQATLSKNLRHLNFHLKYGGNDQQTSQGKYGLSRPILHGP